ncbi:Zinc finger, RING/FYVE/PHD-type [Phytophthora cactorum]|nr:Zinc finger, RING/FYVE/PHD-type [Phytophthora cactorum]
MDVSELLSESPSYVCEGCLHDFGRSDHLRQHQQGRCRGVPTPPCQLCENCWQWVRGNRYHLTRHQRSTRCRPLADRIAHRYRIAEGRRERDAAWHRRRREQRSVSDDTAGDAPNQLVPRNVMDDDDAMGNQLTPRNQLDGLLLASDEEQMDDLLGFAEFEWDEIQFDAASRVEEVAQEDSTGRGGEEDQADADVQDEAEEGVQEDPDDAVQDGAEEAVQGREGVTDCSICLSRLEGKLWVCSCDTCRQPYHRECIMQAVVIDPRCGNCREPISIDVDDDEVLVVGHVAAPPKTQCSHTVHLNCLVQYNEQYLNKTRNRDLQYPLCLHPFTVHELYMPGSPSDDDDNSAINDDNAFITRNRDVRHQ